MLFLGACNTYWGGEERWGIVKERVNLEDPGIDGRIILRLILKKWKGVAWTGLIWITTGRGGGLFVTAVTNLRVQ